MDYKELRKAEYPPLEDFVDAFIHMQRGSAEMMDEYVKKCFEVKEKYPKPE